MNMAMHYLITRVLQLGIRRLSEPCKAWCVGLLLYLADMPNAHHDTKDRVKATFKTGYTKQVRKTSDIRGAPLVLPMPELLKVENPSLFAQVFPKDQPIPSRIDLTMVTLPKVDCRGSPWLCRWGRRVQQSPLHCDSWSRLFPCSTTT